MEFFSAVKPHVWLTLIGSVFILTGLIFVYVSVQAVRGHVASQSWPQADAVLTGAEVVKRIRERNDDENYRQYVTYFCEVIYSYSVGGEAFSATKWMKAESRDEAVKLAAAQETGDRVQLYYDPMAPESYRFELSSPIWGLVWLLPFLAFAGFGWGIIYMGRKFYME